MKQSHLDLLACPHCEGERLALEGPRTAEDTVEEGEINCISCHTSFPVVRGIPRLFTGAERKVFHQSKVYSYYHSLHTKQETFLPQAHRAIMLGTLGYSAAEMRGKTILDAGCGIGRYSSVLSTLAPDGLVVAMDLSLGVEQAKKNLSDRPNCLFIQGDVTHPPFRKGRLDAVVSWGVIHHTPRARQAFARLSELLKDRGRLGIFVYEFHPVLTNENWRLVFVALMRQYLAIKPLRFLCTRLPVGAMETVSFLSRMACATLRFDPLGVAAGPPGDRFNAAAWRRVFIDRFHTRFASEHSCQEVLSWFYEEGFDDIDVPAGCPAVTISGAKGRPPDRPMTMRTARPMVATAGGREAARG